MTEMIDRVLALPDTQRRVLLASLTQPERIALWNLLESRSGDKYRQWAMDPVGFVEHVLHETAWSKQREILESVRDNQRTAVPACHAPGKSHIASRAIAWWVATHPYEITKVVTTATTFRQVRNILWPHIRKVVQKNDLPGEILTVEWKINGEQVAYGFSAADNDEAAVQGEHTPNLLVVVDEAGGISVTLGQALEALMTGGARLLVIGNPATNDEDSWFERCCTSPLYKVIRIAATDTPDFTGEPVGLCGSCPPVVAPHPITKHLVDRQWVDNVITQFGAESAWVQARVHALFPHNATDKVIPYEWVEFARSNDTPDEADHLRVGIDVAADGGDELAVAFADGWRVKIVHTSSGSQNANAVDVAGRVLPFIQEACRLAREREHTKRPRIKVDAIGVGWGVCGILEKWGKPGPDQRHTAQIIAVNVGETPRNATKFSNQRAEMWWNGRELLQPDPDSGHQKVSLDIADRVHAQMSDPKYEHTSSGLIKIEPKDDIRKRTQRSPDLAEAILLALYEPPGSDDIPTVRPLSLTQANAWGAGQTGDPLAVTTTNPWRPSGA